MAEATLEQSVKPRSRRYFYRLSNRLTAAQLAIDNTLADANLQAQLAEYGYNRERLLQGRALYQAVRDMQNNQQVNRGAKRTSSDSFQAIWQHADDVYMRYVKIARVALRDQRGESQSLVLDGKRQRTIAGWIQQAQQFYTNALAQPPVLDKLLQFNITEGRLRDGQALVAAVEAANATQRRTRGIAQQATQNRDAALEALMVWYRDFVSIARVAFEDQPQLLEELGILAVAE